MDDPAPPLKAFMTKRVLITIGNYAFLSFVQLGITVLYPLVYSTAVELGGLGLESDVVGTALAIQGLSGGFVSILIFNKCVDRWPPRRVYICATLCSLPVLAAFPIMNALSVQYGHEHWSVFMVMALQIFFALARTMPFGKMSVLSIGNLFMIFKDAYLFTSIMLRPRDHRLARSMQWHKHLPVRVEH